MDVVDLQIHDVRPYVNNPRVNEAAVGAVAESIERFGFKQPIVVDSEKVIVVGHTRWMAAKRLGMETVPVLIADDLSEAEARAYRLADNRVGELADWDWPKLQVELQSLSGLDFSIPGFDEGDWFTSGDLGEAAEGEAEYKDFVDKFEAKHTTDDCYTPDGVYDVLAGWVASRWGLDRADFVRPFFPGGDYQHHFYPGGCVVVDNPPFSILAEIRRFFIEKGIKYFLFAPQLTIFSASIPDCKIPLSVDIEYKNGARISTGFVTNIPDLEIAVYPDLLQTLERAIVDAREAPKPEYRYPVEVLTASACEAMGRRGMVLEIPHDGAKRIAGLEAQKSEGKAVFGGGMLIPTKLGEQIQNSMDLPLLERPVKERDSYFWTLSQIELDILSTLNDGGELWQEKQT